VDRQVAEVLKPLRKDEESFEVSLASLHSCCELAEEVLDPTTSAAEQLTLLPSLRDSLSQLCMNAEHQTETPPNVKIQYEPVHVDLPPALGHVYTTRGNTRKTVIGEVGSPSKSERWFATFYKAEVEKLRPSH